MKRLLAIAGALGAALGAILWFLLLASTSADTIIFANQYPLILGLNVLVAAVLLGLVGWQVHALWREHRAQVFGSRLKLRLMLMFGLVAVVPGTLVYGVSVQFVTRSIESWFDVRVEKALESGLSLGRSALDSLLGELAQKARSMATELADRPENAQGLLLSRLREQAGVNSAALFAPNGQLITSSQAELASLLPPLPSPSELKQARNSRTVTAIEGEGDAMTLRVLVPVTPLTFFEQPRVLQLSQPVPAALAENAEAVQEVYRDYQELQLARQGLTQIYALTLTLTVLVALFAAFALAFFMARRLSAPLSILAEGTQAVAQGDYSPRQAIDSRDELGVLTQSFNQMTRQLDDARREAERHRSEVESARAYLESILANLSAGVLVFDRHFALRTINEGAITILGERLQELVGQPTDAWNRHPELGQFIRQHFGPDSPDEWQGQLELEQEGSVVQVLLLRGTRLPDASGGGHVVVFDDVTQLIAAQRSAAWGEVARRLAHEIKNPLTPIQLSAERLRYKLADRLGPEERQMLERATQTIIDQVEAMKNLVNAFRDYARLPAPKKDWIELQALLRSVLVLYESSPARLELDLAQEPLPALRADASQMRQVLHNLIQNAQDALEGRQDGMIRIEVRRNADTLILRVLDNGPGFPPELLRHAFEPYFTTKPKGS